jgi:hypothetical protein
MDLFVDDLFVDAQCWQKFGACMPIQKLQERWSVGNIKIVQHW